jgi:Zn-dependent peptidase ImmA (M78 family)
MPGPAPQTMPTLFSRLKRIGYDEAFLRTVVLPDWWEDSLAEDATSRVQIELRVAQRLSLPLSHVADPSRPLHLPTATSVRLKRAKAGTERSDVTPGIIAARNAVSLVLPHLRNVPPLPANLTAAELRRRILATNRAVDLGALAEACWTHGIAVFHFAPLPKAAKKFAGMAYYEGDRPVIVLASGYDAPPRQAFHLAHEIGHVLRGHVKPGGDVLADADLDTATEDAHEHEADGDALQLLSGQRTPAFKTLFGLTAPKLRDAAQHYQEKHEVHAGSVALIYGKTANRMPVAAAALKLMNMDAGARAIVAEALRRRLISSEPGHPFAELPGAVVELLPVFGVEGRG